MLHTYVPGVVVEERGHGVEGHRPDFGLVDCTTILPDTAGERENGGIKEVRGGVAVPLVYRRSLGSIVGRLRALLLGARSTPTPSQHASFVSPGLGELCPRVFRTGLWKRPKNSWSFFGPLFADKVLLY